MTRTEQIKLANALCAGLRQAVLLDADKWPENWDGFELRQLVEDKAREQINYRPMKGKRRKAFKNECLIALI